MRERLMTSTQPLMPKATAVWLVENTALSFEQIADFCKLHPLEVKAIADGEAAQMIKGLDPVLTSQLSREDIARAEADPKVRLRMAERDLVAAPQSSRAQGCANHAPGWHDQADHRVDPLAQPLERQQPAAVGPGDARPLLADRPRFRGRACLADRDAVGGAGKHRRDPSPGIRDHHRGSAGGSRGDGAPGAQRAA